MGVNLGFKGNYELSRPWSESMSFFSGSEKNLRQYAINNIEIEIDSIPIVAPEFLASGVQKASVFWPS